jgi:acetyl-CoA synthetase
MGRLDDVINVSGHRLGTAEIESALVSHPRVSEAAVVGMPHPIKGQAIYAFVTLIENGEQTPSSSENSGFTCAVKSGPSPRPTPSSMHRAAKDQKW